MTLAIDPELQEWFETLPPEAQQNFLADISGGAEADVSYYEKYQEDPVLFGKEQLGYEYTSDVERMLESVRDNPVILAQSSNAIGKSHGAATACIWFYKCFPGAQVYTAAAPPASNLKRVLWGEINSVTNKAPNLFPHDQLNVMHIQRTPKSFITGVAIPASGTDEAREAKFSGKHAPYLMFVIDEGDAVPDEVYRAIESSSSGGITKLLVLFNPRSKIGPVYRMQRDRQAVTVKMTAFNHPNVIAGKNIIPGAVTRAQTITRINEWTRPLADGETVLPDSSMFYEVHDYLVGETTKRKDGTEYPPLKAGWRKVKDPAFCYMVMGLYPEQAVNQLISMDNIMRAVNRWNKYVEKHGEKPPDGVRPLMGLDVAEYGGDLNCAIYRYDNWIAMPKVWMGMDADAVADQGAIYYNDVKAAVAKVDATGVGANVPYKMIRLGCSAQAVKVASSPTHSVAQGMFHILRDQLWWEVKEWLEGTEQNPSEAMLPPDNNLIEELGTPTYEAEGEIRVMTKKEMRKVLGRSPDKADALCLTFAPTGVFLA